MQDLVNDHDYDLGEACSEHALQSKRNDLRYREVSRLEVRREEEERVDSKDAYLRE